MRHTVTASDTSLALVQEDRAKRLRFGIATPSAVQRAPLEKDDCAQSRAVMIGAAFNAGDKKLRIIHRALDSSALPGYQFRG